MRRRMSTALMVALAIWTAATIGCRNGGRAIPQPVVEGLGVAPDQARVDLRLPTFSNPTSITNPLFPISKQESVVFAGMLDGKPFRAEVTRLPYTRIVKWDGVEIEAAVSQYVAYLDGRIAEAAIDLYAQADDGSVWYLGEDVSDFKDGVIHSTEGTWHAGIDGPPAMIMPATPKPGDTYRSENIPGIAFEEVTIKSIDQSFDGPFGLVRGGMVGTELHMDGATEDKRFAPGYGEFLTSEGSDVEALALAVPADRTTAAMPEALKRVTEGGRRIVDEAGAKDWTSTSAAVRELVELWRQFPSNETPRLVGPQVTAALGALEKAVARRDVAETRQAAIDVARWSLDIQLRYRAATAIDLARLDLWAAELLLDAEANNAAAVKGDAFTMMYIRDRVIRSLDPTVARGINTLFGKLQPAASDEKLDAVARIARELRQLLAPIVR